ncbi:EAL domain-containing protein [Leptolyngbya cf. ectocarpi LEGE 11479]|uniref:EAL domain-containing protein n=1 Tax=Leptolyngbya cf. ectocarpi LEGE 11479 TaxID=1828722 RepID=A0A928ZWX4_LEPEC|nr:hormogonium polysaccharide biosynthesis glycosyltransferase HpsE [Leptolyngbya ectocarpi]MBE9068953.1 EAL domain-containing protein [Leptolyngbya cf. ectocarpi LEGE 11479]
MMTVDYPPNKSINSPVVAPLCLDITVAIPTYNGADRIPEVLDRLKQQSGTEGLTWEVIICDNNSCDRTPDVVAEYQQAWLQNVPLRYCFVAEQGAAFARQRAVVEAHGNIVAFLDDDNIPAPDWLSHVQRFAKAYPQAGAFGSQIHGNFQGELPEGFGHIACFLAIVERGSKPHLYSPKSKILPPAAGLAVRRKVWLDAVPPRLFLNHKGKSAGLASEDLEAMLHVQKAGWEIWYNSDMVVTHQIPRQRLQQDYLVALLRCVGLSRFYIRWLGTQDWQRFFKVPAYIANDLRKLALHYLKNGPRQSTLNTVAACERSLLKSTLISPAFLLRKAYQDFWQNRLDDTQLPERQQWLQRLTDAFEGRQLDLYQQAVISLTSPTPSRNHIAVPSQYEILLRLRHSSPNASLAVPASFFPTAERYGLMRTLDRRIIQQVCERLSSLAVNAVYSINLSAASVCDPNFLDFLEEQLSRYPLKPENLCFEIQASVLINSSTVAKTLINRLKILGLRVAIDEIVQDAGMLDEITHCSIDCLKLSASMLAADSSHVLAWVKLSQQRGMQLVVKGVETQQMVEQLQALGVRYLQGYYLSKPTSLV